MWHALDMGALFWSGFYFSGIMRCWCYYQALLVYIIISDCFWKSAHWNSRSHSVALVISGCVKHCWHHLTRGVLTPFEQFKAHCKLSPRWKGIFPQVLISLCTTKADPGCRQPIVLHSASDPARTQTSLCIFLIGIFPFFRGFSVCGTEWEQQL